MPRNRRASLNTIATERDEGPSHVFRHEQLTRLNSCYRKESAMRITTRWIPALAALTSLIAACDNAPLAPANREVSPRFSAGAERTVDEALYDLTDSFFTFACSENGDVL